MPTYDAILNAFVTLFVTMDPIGTAPLFLGLTAGMAASHRRHVALRGVVLAFLILALFAVTGTKILDGMGITIAAFRVAGGLLLFYTAFEMIYAKRQERKEETSQSAIKEKIANIAVFPLAIPLIAGPGSISATILLSSQMASNRDIEPWLATLTLLGVIFTLLVIMGVVLVAAERLDKYLGNTGRMVLSRLLGVLLAALSVQYVADGARALFG